jgi:intracellular multiplication protein IcmG
MTKNIDKFQDDEYQFPIDGYEESLETPAEPEFAENHAEPLTAAEDSAPGRLAEIWEKHKRTIIIVGVVVVVAVTFATMRALHSPADTIAPPALAPVTAPAAPMMQPVIDPQVTDQLNGLRQESINNNVAVRQLQGQVVQLTNSLSQSRAAQQQLNQSLMVLVGQVQQLTAEVKTLAHPKPAAAPAAPKKLEPVITYQLRAVVPGRAWIVDSDGESHSVAVGDTVRQYGNVQSIDADTGVVITTSGKTIKF